MVMMALLLVTVPPFSAPLLVPMFAPLLFGLPVVQLALARRAHTKLDQSLLHVSGPAPLHFESTRLPDPRLRINFDNPNVKSSLDCLFDVVLRGTHGNFEGVDVLRFGEEGRLLRQSNSLENIYWF